MNNATAIYWVYDGIISDINFPSSAAKKVDTIKAPEDAMKTTTGFFEVDVSENAISCVLSPIPAMKIIKKEVNNNDKLNIPFPL